MESIGIPSSPFERARKEIHAKLERAESAAVDEQRVSEIESELSSLYDTFIEQGKRSPEVIKRETELEEELLRGAAIVDTIVEFREMLEQLRSRWNLSREWASDLLEHENAHSNVAELTGHDLIGYAALFIKDKDGNLVSVQPLALNRPNLSWGPLETVTKNIDVTRAPERYGNTLSEGDMYDIQKNTERLDRIHSLEQQLRDSSLGEDG